MTSATKYKPPGVPQLPTKDSDKLLRRIKMLHDMDVRHLALLLTGDRDGLLELAQEYQDIFAVDTANRIRAEVKRMTR